MSVAVCRAALCQPISPVSNGWVSKPEIGMEEEEEWMRLDIWSSIQKNKEKIMAAPPPAYIHPLAQHSSSLMSQKSLELCTESLGSETGSCDFSSSGDEFDSSLKSETEYGGEEAEEEEEEDVEIESKDPSNVNYHCSIGRRSQVRSFPPPLPSISRRDGLCFKMQPHRHNGRLVLEAVPAPSHNYLQAERHGGRLLLSFIDTSTRTSPLSPTSIESRSEEEDNEDEALREMEEEEEAEEEEVEVVDRGTTVEVKVSTQPQAVSGATTVKVHRSSLVINKFVVGSPLPEQGSPTVTGKRMNMATTTAAAAAVVASSISTPSSTTEGFQYNYIQQKHDDRWGPQSPAAAAAADAKLLFTSKRRSKEELLHDMRRCSELRRPLFIFEQPHCIATS